MTKRRMSNLRLVIEPWPLIISLFRICSLAAWLGVSTLPGCSASPRLDEAATAVAELKKLGARVSYAEVKPGDVRLRVELAHAPGTDAALVHLKALTHLRELDLSGTEVTDAGLGHLEGLSQLQKLDLGETGVTDAGLAHLQGLTQLRTLDLGTPR